MRKDPTERALPQEQAPHGLHRGGVGLGHHEHLGRRPGQGLHGLAEQVFDIGAFLPGLGLVVLGTIMILVFHRMREGQR